MANPLEAQKIPLNPTGPIERRPVDPGHLEPDDFIINDVPLRIPPAQIHVQKKAFNREWQTLRTNSSQKVKTGMSLARVSFSIEFRMADSDDRRTLIKLIAGLRATPFCVANSLYLDRTLGRPDDTATVSAENKRYKNFKPIMLALASMTFETLGHEKTPDKLRGTFDFVWFNYLPFTNMVAFKSGEDATRPGHPWESEIWQRFYAPYETKSEPVQWPHKREDLTARTTEFMWREFLAVPKSNPMATMATKEIVDALRNQPQRALNTINEVLRGTIDSGAPNPKDITEGVFETVYRKLVQKGYINIDQAMKEYLDSAPNGSLSAAASGVLSPLIRKLNQKSGISKDDIREIDFAAGLMAGRLKKMTDIQGRQDVAFGLAQDGKFVKLLDSNAKYQVKDKDTFVSGLELFGRKRRYKIAHIPNPVDPPEMITTRISVTFENILATIPMVGYRYPTVQHIGSIDARINMVIDAKNSAVGDLNQMYDSIETNALRYKQIPQGLNNLWINNDFLKLFGLSEFITDSITMDTMPGSPGRSIVSLSCVEAGVTSSTKLQDASDSPETLQQENVQSSTSLRQSIWKELWKKTMMLAGSAQSHDVSYWNLFKEQAASLVGIKGKTDLTSATGSPYYFRRVVNIPTDNNNRAYRTIVQSAVTAYNELLVQAHKQIFNVSGLSSLTGGAESETIAREIRARENSTSFVPVTSGAVNANVLFSLSENDPNIGYIPGLEYLKKSVRERNSAYVAAKQPQKTVAITTTEEKRLEHVSKAKKRARFLAGEDPASEQKELDLLRARRQRLDDLGITAYQAKIRKLLDDVARKHLLLEPLKHLRRQVEREGLQKGIMAYPDFRAQLASVAGALEEGSALSDTELMKYDPDCYFWYPTYDGTQASPLTGLVDDHYLLEAKRHSKAIYDNAQGSVGHFFQQTYQSLLKSDENEYPYKHLTEVNNAATMADPFFAGDNIVNATQHPDEPMKVTVVPDAGIKVPTNWYPEKEPQIRSKHLLSHSTDMDALWDGMNTSANADAFRAAQGSSNVSLPSSIPKPTSTRRSGSGSGVDASGNLIRDYAKARPFAGGWTQADLSKVSPLLVRKLEGIFPRLIQAGWNPKVIYGLRSADQQDELIRRGTGGRNSRHLTGDAVDIVHNKAGISGATKKKFFDQLGAAAEKVGLQWGGRFTRNGRPFYDGGHVQLSAADRRLSRAVQAGQRHMPNRISQDRIDRITQTPVQNSPTDILVSPMRASIEEFEKSLLNGQGQSMMRAYPTFKLYFIEDDSGERKRLAFDDFFSYNSVQSIRVIRSRKIAADLCELHLTNISGVLSNRKFRQNKRSVRDGETLEQPRTNNGEIAQESTKVMRTNTVKENPMASLLLQEGIQISLRLGYSSDPDRLDTVFNGVITGVGFSESDDMVTVIAQSHAIELVQDIKGLEKPTTSRSYGVFGWNLWWGFGEKSSTARVLEEMMAQPEVLHFGRWDANTDERNAARELLTQRWTFQPQPADDNIFAPSPSKEFEALANRGGFLKAGKALAGTVFSDNSLSDVASAFADKWQYTIYRTTIWDICQEMTRRHPNFIASAVPYKDKSGERMTMFYGLPNQLYFARHPSADEEFADERLRQTVKDGIDKVMASAVRNQLKRKDELQRSLIDAHWDTAAFLERGELGKAVIAGALSTPMRRAGIKVNNKTIPAIVAMAKENGSIASAINKFLRHKRLELARSAGHIKPFRNYHLLTSSQHIISNNIQANSRNVANNIVIKYGGEVDIKDSDGKVAIKGQEEEFSLKLDNAIPQEDLRTQVGQFVNVTNKELAKRYALSMLCDNIKEIYKGDVEILGNGSIKPYDVCYMFDEYTDMIGAVEVEAVEHIFDQNHGFRTVITPDMLVQAAEWSLLGSSEAMGVVMEGALHKLIGTDGPPTSTGGKILSFSANMVGRGVALVGGFMSQKILNYTQLGQPVVMSPLLHHGRVFSGGVPTRKIPTSLWTTVMGEWNNNVATGFDMAMEDGYDSIANWLKKVTFQNTTGNFWNNEGDD